MKKIIELYLNENMPGKYRSKALVEVLNRLYNFDLSYEQFEADFNMYEHVNRYYHNTEHIMEMLVYVHENYEDKLGAYQMLTLIMAIIYHDMVYDPMSKTNEEDSAALFLKHFEQYPDRIKQILGKHKDKIVNLIMATKKHEYDLAPDLMTQAIIKADLDRFNKPFEEVWPYTIALYNEYMMVDTKLFIEGRIQFLLSYADKIRTFMGELAYENIHKIHTAMRVWQPKIGVYAGSFDPLHKGHINIIEKARKIFDRVILAVGHNPDKGEKKYEIPACISNICQVEYFQESLPKFVSSLGYPVTVIRGIRNTTDMQYELNQLRWFQEMMPSFNMVSIFCDKEYEHISSSALKKILPHDPLLVKKYLPNEIMYRNE